MPREELTRSVRSVTNRRRFLKTIGASGVAVTVAGCSGGGDGSDGGGDGDGDEGGGDGGGGNDTGEIEAGSQVPTLSYVSLSEGTHPIRNTWGQMHTEQLRELGFQVDYEALSVPDYIDRGFNQRTYDIYILRYLDGFDPDRVLHDAFHSEAAVEGGGNCSQYRNDEYDQMYAEQRATVDPDERQGLVHEMQEFLMERQIITPVMVQNRRMPYDTRRVQNPTSMLEFGLGCIYNFQSIEPGPQKNSNQLNWAQPEDLTTLNPLNPERGRVERNVNRLVYDRLMRIPPDSVNPQPWMAEEINRPDDVTKEITLREGLKWHDGEDVTAEDVKFTYEYGAEVSPNVAGIAEPIENITVESDREVTFELSEPIAPFETRAFAGREAQIIPKHVWENVPEEVDAETATEWTNPEPVGSGPFQVESFTLGEELELSGFDAYGDAGFDVPNFEQSVRLQAPDIRTTVRQLEDGTIDFIPYEIQPTDIDRFEQDQNIEMVDALMTSIHYATYNMNRELFADNEVGKAVRRAMAYAVPKQNAIDVATGGNARELQSCFSTGLEFWYNDDVETFNLDLDAAREELESVGFTWENDRIHFPSDYP